jgi:hypothetical protein
MLVSFPSCDWRSLLLNQVGLLKDAERQMSTKISDTGCDAPADEPDLDFGTGPAINAARKGGR